jgi:AraC-like DNA-binding protein
LGEVYSKVARHSAVALLAHLRQTIASVCCAAEFESLCHFNMTFRSPVGMSSKDLVAKQVIPYPILLRLGDFKIGLSIGYVSGDIWYNQLADYRKTASLSLNSGRRRTCSGLGCRSCKLHESYRHNHLVIVSRRDFIARTTAKATHRSHLIGVSHGRIVHSNCLRR